MEEKPELRRSGDGAGQEYLDVEHVDVEKTAEERAAEAVELDELLAEQESMGKISRLDDDGSLVLYQSPASERRSDQTGLTP